MTVKLLVVRHAIAEDRARFAATGKDDAERPLTLEGKRKMRKGARGILALIPSLDAIASSVLLRAVDTAGILARAYGENKIVQIPELRPEAKPAALVPWLRKQAKAKVLAVVGHEPHLSRTVSALLAPGSRPFVILKKGGACLLCFAVRPAAGRAQLEWLLTPSQLRRLGG